MSGQSQGATEEQFTLKDVFVSLLAAKDAILKSWKQVLLITFLGLGIGWGLDLYLKKPPSYVAEVVFNLGTAGGGSGMPAGLGNLFGMGGTADANIFTGENFFIWVKSSPVFKRALLKTVKVNDQEMLLANLYLDSSDIKDNRWKDAKHLHDFRFVHAKADSFNTYERVVLNELIEDVAAATTIDELGKKSSFMELSVTTINENLSTLWANTLLETVDEFYAEIQTTKTRKTLNLLEKRADSLGRVLSGSERRLAVVTDQSIYSVEVDKTARLSKLARDNEFVQRLYLEALAGAEQTRVSLVREAPLFTIIEPIKSPLDLTFDPGQRKKIGALLGLLIALVFVYFKSAYQEAVKEKQSKKTDVS
jgi:uncharacterized membrane protein